MFTVCTYTIVALYCTTIGIAVDNFVTFIVKGGKCQASHPLFGFYILMMLTMMTDAIYSLLITKIYDTLIIVVLVLPATFKFLAGVEQVWILIELVLNLKIEVQVR